MGLTRLLPTLLLAWMSAGLICQAAQVDRYRETLRELGIAPSAAGAAEYLQNLHPSPQREKEISQLIEQLGDSSFSNRETAMQKLLRMPSLPAAQLSAATESNDPEVRWRSREVLKLSAGKSSQAIYAALKVIAVESAEQPAAGSVAALLAAVPLCTQPHLQTAAVEALRAAARAKDAPVIGRMLAEGTSRQRQAAAATLCAISTESDRDRLYPLLTDRDDQVAIEVASSLADVGDRAALKPLVRLLNSEDNTVRTSAAVMLRGLTGKYMGFAAYEDAGKRYDAVKKWNTWVTNQGDTAELAFPVPRGSGARGDLGGNTLVSTGSKGEVHLFDPSGKSIWTFPAQSWSAEKLLNGNFLIASFNGNKIQEVEQATGKVVWEHSGINAMTAKPLVNGNFIVSDFGGQRVIEIDRDKQIVWEHKTGQNCFDSDRLPNGNTIFGCPAYVREVTSDGDLVREWKIPGRLNGFQALPSGNILVANYGQGEVVELTPQGKRVWEFKEPGPCDAYRLPTGNTLISTIKRIIEIDPDKKLIREICDAKYGSARM